MFFRLADKKDKNKKWPHKFELTSRYLLETDEGWSVEETRNNKIIYKGYQEFTELKKLLINYKGNAPVKGPGNFLAFLVQNDETIHIIHPEERTSPIYYSKLAGTIEVSNMNPTKYRDRLMRDEFLMIKNNGTLKIEPFFPCVSSPIVKKSEEEVIQELNSYLDKKISHFFNMNSDAQSWLFHSRGADTTTLYSYILKNNLPVNLIKNEHREETQFYKEFKDELNLSWNYRQIHHWSKPSILLSGANGDETLLRNPLSGALLLSLAGINPLKLIRNNANSYNSLYLFLDKNKRQLKRGMQRGWIKSFFNKTDRDFFYNELKFYMLDDYQHWHFGNTLTYTPFKDIQLLQIVLQAPEETWKKQFTDAYLNKRIIEMNAPELLNKMSHGKNED
jgi:hypothetical protein